MGDKAKIKKYKAGKDARTHPDTVAVKGGSTKY